MKRSAFVVMGLTGVLSGCALNQPARPSSNTAAAKSAASSPITELNVRASMSFLASDALNGRASGSRDEWIAASYIGSQLQQWGLEPLGDDGGFVQRIGIQRFETASPPTLAAGGRTFTHGNDIRVTSVGAPRVSGPLVKHTAGTAVKPGAVLLMPSGAPMNDPGLAQAAAIVIPESPNPKPVPPRLPAPAPQLVGTATPPRSRPSVLFANKEVVDRLTSLSDGTPVTIEADVKQAALTHTWNAVGRLTGSDPAQSNEVIVLSAHLDHIGVRANAAPGSDAINNGADDDASGTIAVLELARGLAAGPRPKRTIVFALFGSEEAGGLGSAYFADKPVVPLTRIVANLQFEMIGRPDGKVPPSTLWLTGYERSTLGPTLAKQGAKLVQDPHPDQNFFERSDNIQFARRGVVAHTVSSYGLHKEYHQPSDEIKMIDFAHMTESIRSMLEPIRWLANSGFKPDWLPGKKP